MNTESSFTVGYAVKVKHGALLKALKERGWSQSDGARYLGMAPTAFGKLMNLQWRPRRLSIDHMTRLLELTGQSVDDLFPGFIGDPQFQSKPRDFELYQEVPTHRLEYAASLLPSPEDIVERREQLAAVRDKLSELSPRQAQAIEHWLEGLSIDESATEMEITHQGARHLRNKAIEVLQKKLGLKSPKLALRPIVRALPSDWEPPAVRKNQGQPVPPLEPKPVEPKPFKLPIAAYQPSHATDCACSTCVPRAWCLWCQKPLAVVEVVERTLSDGRLADIEIGWCCGRVQPITITRIQDQENES